MSRILGVALLGYVLFLTVLTRSRTSLLLIALSVVVYYLVLVFRRKRIIGGFLLLGAVVLLGFLIIKFIPEVVEGVIKRFTEEEDLSNGRVDLFEFYIKKWIETPWCFLFGYGLGSVFDALGISDSMSPHNAITDILIAFGLVGFFLIVGIVSMCWARGARKIEKKDRVMALLPAVVALLASMAGQYVDTGFPHPRLCFLFLATQAWSAEKLLNAPFEEKIDE